MDLIASIIHVTLGADCDCERDLCTMPYSDIVTTMPVSKTRALRRAMLVNNVDMMDGVDEVIEHAPIKNANQALEALRGFHCDSARL